MTKTKRLFISGIAGGIFPWIVSPILGYPWKVAAILAIPCAIGMTIISGNPVIESEKQTTRPKMKCPKCAYEWKPITEHPKVGQ